MPWGYSDPSNQEVVDNKAGYNQAGRITEVLANLRNTFVSSMIDNDFSGALECCRGVLNIISGKVSVEEIDELDGQVYAIEDLVPSANQWFENEGKKFYKNSETRKTSKVLLELLWRALERLQDRYGYGMFSEDESGL